MRFTREQCYQFMLLCNALVEDLWHMLGELPEPSRERLCKHIIALCARYLLRFSTTEAVKEFVTLLDSRIQHYSITWKEVADEIKDLL